MLLDWPLHELTGHGIIEAEVLHCFQMTGIFASIGHINVSEEEEPQKDTLQCALKSDFHLEVGRLRI